MKTKQKFLISIALIVSILILYLVNRKSNYAQQVEIFNKVEAIKAEEILKNKEKVLLYVGRETCPACVEFVPILSEFTYDNNIEVYYLDSTDTENNKEIKTFRNYHKIEYVPSLIVKVGEKITYPKIPNDKDELLRILQALKYLN